MMSPPEKAELADIKRRWSALLDKCNDGTLSDSAAQIGIALFATLNVDRLIILAETRALFSQRNDEPFATHQGAE